MAANAEIPLDLYPSESDLPYEEEILRDPFKLKGWWRYLVARASSPFKKRSILYERALKALPGSYKLWHAYLRERLDAVRPFPITHPSYASLNNTFERALVTMHRMPRIWIMYLSSLSDQRLLIQAQRTFDRALRALPVTQHDLIWPLYLKLVSLPGVPVQTSFWVYRRYLAFDPSPVEDDSDNEMDGEDGGKDGTEKLAKKFLEGCWLNDDGDAALRLACFERFDRRPELLNSVLLRQNPHNVEQWHRHDPLALRDNSSILPNAQQGSELSGSRLYNKAGIFHSLGVNNAEKAPSVNKEEGSIIPDILALDFDQWDDSSSLPNSLAAPWRCKSSGQSRFCWPERVIVLCKAP